MFLVFRGTTVFCGKKKYLKYQQFFLFDNETDVFGRRLWRWNVFRSLPYPNSLTRYTVFTAVFSMLRHILITFTHDRSRLELGINTFVWNIAVRKRYPKTTRDFVAGPNGMPNIIIVWTYRVRETSTMVFRREPCTAFESVGCDRAQSPSSKTALRERTRFSVRFSDSFRVQRLCLWCDPGENVWRITEIDWPNAMGGIYVYNHIQCNEYSPKEYCFRYSLSLFLSL